jgi:hypothetical protein
MIYGFDCADEHAATAALLVYVVWRSRDRARYKITPDLWGQIERFVKDSAKRATSLAEFVEALKSPRRINAPSLHPRHMEVGLAGEVPLVAVHDQETGRVTSYLQFSPDRESGAREFAVRVLERANHRAVIDKLYRETGWIILLVRDRIEREKPIEQHLHQIEMEDVL